MALKLQNRSGVLLGSEVIRGTPPPGGSRAESPDPPVWGVWLKAEFLVLVSDEPGDRRGGPVRSHPAAEI